MMSWNSVMISDWNNKKQAIKVFPAFHTCLEHIWFESLSGSYTTWESFSLHFWENNTGCFTGASLQNPQSVSGVFLWGKQYYLTAEVQNKTDEKITLNTNIFSEVYGNISLSGSEVEIIKK